MNLLVENQTVETLFQSIAGVKPAVVSRQPRIANIERLRIVSAFGVASFHTHEWFPHLPIPLVQWNLGLPVIPLGFAIGRIKILQRTEDRKKYFVFVILSTLTACVGCMVLARLRHGKWMDYGIIFAIRYFVFLVIFCFALHWRGTLDPVSANLASLSYGIYLVCPLVLVFFYQFSIAIQHPLLLLFLDCLFRR